MFPRRHDAADLPRPHLHTFAQRRSFPRLADPSRSPFISVLVPVRNEAAFITQTLAQLLEQDYGLDRFEVIVADGESTDATRDRVRALQVRYPNLHLVPNPGRWSSAGRNAALEVARGDLVVVIDGHCDLDNARYLTELANAFERSGADCVGRPQPLDISQATTVQRAIAATRSSRLGHHPDSHIYSSAEGFVPPQSVAVAYRRKVFEAVGTFDEGFDACEDVEFNHRVSRAGLKCFFTPNVAVRYHPRATLRGLIRQMVRYGRGRVRLLRKHRETFTPLGFVPALFVLGLLAGPLLAGLSSVLAAVYLGSLAFYTAAVLAGSLGIAWKARDWRLLPWCPPVFLAIHLGAGAGILLESLKPGRLSVPAGGQRGVAPAPRRAA
jgi:succinoglycan biosynthesis protein ExoA